MLVSEDCLGTLPATSGYSNDGTSPQKDPIRDSVSQKTPLL
jgi:hypothetical protein